LLLSLFFVPLLHAQVVVSPSGIYSTVPRHKHFDSIYAKALFYITIHPGNKKDFRLYKTICDNCDSSTIREVGMQCLKIALMDNTIKRILPTNTDRLEEKNIYPVQISIIKHSYIMVK